MSGPWKRVVFTHELGPNDECPVCGEDYSDGCPCPGPTMDGWEYEVQEGVLMARELDEEEEDFGEMLEDINEQIGKLVYAGLAEPEGSGGILDMDLALTEGPDGKPLLHVADCPDARAAAAAGAPVFTMFGCENPPPNDIERHSCFKEAVDRARSAVG